MDDLITDFVTETTESLALLDQELVRFERNPADKNILGNIFRVMHTIKGTCGFLGLPRLERVAHAGEDVLGKFRDGELEATPDSVTLILRCIDQIRAVINEIAESGKEGVGDDDALIQDLRAMADGTGVSASHAAPSGESAIEETAPPAGSPAVALGGFPVASELLAEVEAISSTQAPKPQKPAPEKAPIKAVHSAPAPTAAAAEPSDSGREKAHTPAQNIRVNVDVLENLMTMVSEMVLTRNELLQLSRIEEESVFKDPIQRLSRITSELQEGVMKTRMQPIGHAWGKLPRIVRDLAHELGKKITLDMHGEETELDRQVLELIQDPLTHMVRNCADHGLETPADRLAAGKNETGTIRLSAHHEGGHIIIAIVDNGRGLNTAKIKSKILERGLATQNELDSMDDDQIHQYIMRPGFSTADQVTKVSGRGVGMDVVRSNIERIGGTIEFKSTFGEGSSFTIKIPLTLAIIAALIVQSGGERFAIPQIAVSEVVRISKRSEHKIESLNGTPVLRLRDTLMPLINLRELLNLPEPAPKAASNRASQASYIVVSRSGSQILGIIVDGISDAEEIVVKPLSSFIPKPRYFSGNTILGDGRVILILDTNGLASKLSAETTQAIRNEEQFIETKANIESILLFRSAAEGLKAVPLSKVNRIESFDMATSEIVQGEVVVQYRNRLLPIQILDGDIRRTGRQTVLVFGSNDILIGMAIDQIIDIVEDELRIERVSRTPGIAGSSIISGKAADILAPEYFLPAAADKAASPDSIQTFEVAA